MLLVDSRLGDTQSKNKSFFYYLPDGKAELTQLEYGDVAFEANGVTVGIECKRVLDAVNCMYSGRLADHQLPGLRGCYDICYLLVEGLWRAEPESGVLQIYRGELGKWGQWTDALSGWKRLLYSSFEHYLLSMSQLSGVTLLSTPSAQETASLLLSLETWWAKGSHGSFRVMQEHMGPELTRPTMLRRMIALLPRVGWSRSAILAQRFSSVQQLTDASVEQFLIPNEIAMPTAMKIWEAIHGVEYETTGGSRQG